MATRRTSVIQVMITGDARDLNKATKSGSDGMGLLGAAAITAAKVVTSALSGIAAFSIREFARFDQAMTQSQAIMGDLSDTTKKAMSDVAREVGVTTTFAAHEAANAFYFLASAGLDAEQSMAAMPRVAAFAQAGMFDLARATDILTDAQSALGMSSQDAGENLANMTELSNVMVGAATLANASVEQFGEAFMRAGARIRMVGMPLQEASAVLGAFADQGVKGAAGGEALSIILRDLPRAADRNSEAFRKLGIQVENADGSLRPMADIISDFERALDGLSATQQANVFTTLGLTRSVADQLSVLVGTSDQIRQYEADLKLMGDVTQEVADKQLQSFSNQLALTRAQFTNIALTIGESLAGPLRQFNLWLREQTPAIEAFVDRALPKVEKFIDDSVKKFGQFRTAFRENVTEPIREFLELDATIAFFDEFRREYDRFIGDLLLLGADISSAIQRNDAEAVGQILGEFVAQIFRTAFGRAEVIGDLIKEAFGAQNFKELGVAVGSVATDFIAGFVIGLLTVPRDAEGEIDKSARTLSRMFTENFTGTFVGALLLSRVPIIGAPIRTLLNPALKGIRFLAGAIAGGLGRIFSRVIGGLVSGTRFAAIFSNIGLTIQRLFAGEFATIPARLLASIKGMFSGLGGFLLREAKMLPTNIKAGFISGLPTLVAYLKTGGLVTLLKGFAAILGGIVVAIGGWPVVIFAAAVLAFQQFIMRFVRWNRDQGDEYEGFGRTVVAFIGQGIVGMATWFMDTVSRFFMNRWADTKELLGKIPWGALGGDIILGIARGIRNASISVENALLDAARNAWEATKNFFKSRSPSMLFAGLGGDLMLGMAQGIDRSASVVTAAMRDVSLDTAAVRFDAPVVPSLAAAAGPTGDTIIINVSGAIDPEATARQIRRILQDAERRSGVRALA